MLFLVHYIHIKILIYLRGIRLYKPDFKNEYAFNHFFVLLNIQHLTNRVLSKFNFLKSIILIKHVYLVRRVFISLMLIMLALSKPERLLSKSDRPQSNFELFIFVFCFMVFPILMEIANVDNCVINLRYIMLCLKLI